LRRLLRLRLAGPFPLTFADPATYDTTGENDHIFVLGLASM
jgi:hypothetical protein